MSLDVSGVAGTRKAGLTWMFLVQQVFGGKPLPGCSWYNKLRCSWGPTGNRAQETVCSSPLLTFQNVFEVKALFSYERTDQEAAFSVEDWSGLLAACCGLLEQQVAGLLTWLVKIRTVIRRS